jgi:hypothetical protein
MSEPTTPKGQRLPVLHFSLDVQPQTPTSPWHAVLRPEPDGAGGQALEFDTPLALARYLAQFLLANPQQQRGLR